MITRNQTKSKTILTFAALAMAALAVGQVQAESIDVPNGDFQTIHKPGEPANTATVPDGCYWSIPNFNIKGGSGPATYADGTTGDQVESPGWVLAAGSNTNPDCMQGGDWGGPDGSGDIAFLCFGTWGGPSVIESAAPLSAPAGGNYTLSADVMHTARPLILKLLVDGVEQTPNTASSPDAVAFEWVKFTRTYNSVPAGDVTIRVGTRNEEGEGWTGTGNRASVDNITLDVEFNCATNPSPADGATVPVGDVDLSWKNMDPNKPGDPVYVDVWFGTEPNELHPGYDMIKVVAANIGDPNRTTWTVNAPVAGTYYWRVDSYVNGNPTGDPIKGIVWSFIAVDDLAPTIVIDTVNMMTWSGQPVPLDATVVDDGVSALTYAWTADPPDGVVFDPSAAVEDPTVTITKSAWAEVAVPNAGFEVRETYDPFPESTDKYNQWGSEYWRHFECDNNGGPLRIWNPGNPGGPGEPNDLTPQGAIDVGFGGNAPEGKYVVLVRSRYNDDEDDPPKITDFEAAAQILTETFDPSASYKLTAKVGRPVGSINYTPDWHGYAVQLAVGGTNVDGASYQGRVDGGTVIAQDDNSLTVPIDTFVTSTVEYTPDPANDHLAGEPLQIRLCALENPADHSLTGWVVFDDVKLTVDNPSDVHTVTLTLAVHDEGNPIPVEDTMTIDVYDDACKMTRMGLGLSEITDFDNNCITDLRDYAVLAAEWLDDVALTAPVPKP